MSKVSLDDIKKLAGLSALLITNEEAARLQNDLETVLSYVEQLDTVDTEGVEPTYQVTGLQNITRPDEIIDYKVSPADLLKNVGAKHGNYIRVRRVL